jgi:zinc-ribbon domain
LPYCSNCGAEVQRGVKFCPECGAPQVMAAVQPVAPAAPPQKKGGLRPAMVTLLSLASLFVGLLMLGIVVLYVLVPPPSSSYSAVAILLGLGILSLGSGYGLLKAEEWAKTMGKVTGVGFVVFGLLLAFGGSTYPGVLSVAFGVGILYLVLFGLPRDYFRP